MAWSRKLRLRGGSSGGLQIINVSIRKPLLAGTYNTPGVAIDAAISGTYAYVADYGAGVRVLDISNPFMPSEAGYFDTDGGVYGVAVSGGYAFLADYNDGSYVVHYSGQCIDPYEPNDQRDTATAMQAGAAYDSFICVSGDQDWYRFEAATPGTLDLYLDPPSGANLELFLYNSAGAILAASTSSGDADESIAYDATGGGDLYVLVRGQSSVHYASWSTYLLYALFTPAGGGSCTLPDEAVYLCVTLDQWQTVLHIRIPIRRKR